MASQPKRVYAPKYCMILKVVENHERAKCSRCGKSILLKPAVMLRFLGSRKRVFQEAWKPVRYNKGPVEEFYYCLGCGEDVIKKQCYGTDNLAIELQKVKHEALPFSPMAALWRADFEETIKELQWCVENSPAPGNNEVENAHVRRKVEASALAMHFLRLMTFNVEMHLSNSWGGTWIRVRFPNSWHGVSIGDTDIARAVVRLAKNIRFKRALDQLCTQGVKTDGES